MSPQRIQQRRTKGWRKPEGAVAVGRGTKWGNPYRVLPVDRHGMYPYGYRVHPEPSGAAARHVYRTEREAVERAVHLFDRYARERLEIGSWDLTVLRGRDLMCWCPLDQPCHADVLLELAN